jgi:hypothetical protein
VIRLGFAEETAIYVREENATVRISERDVKRLDAFVKGLDKDDRELKAIAMILKAVMVSLIENDPKRRRADAKFNRWIAAMQRSDGRKRSNGSNRRRNTHAAN